MSMISVDYDVLNQRGSPAWFSDTFANIPTAGYKGRMFISTDTFAFYRDTGTGWDLIGGPGIGTLTGSGVVGQVSFFNGTQVLAGNNNLFWDNVNSRLGINTTTPGAPLDIHGTGTQIQLNGTGVSNSYIAYQQNNIGKWRVGNFFDGTLNTFAVYNTTLSSNALTISNTTNNITINGNVTASTYYSSAGIFLSTGGQASAGGGYATINGGTNYLDFRPANGGIFLFSFPYNTTRTFTLPDTTGTIALTSNLSSYVPYTGATTNVDLGTFNLTSGWLFANGNGGSNSGVVSLKIGTSIQTTSGYGTIGAATGQQFVFASVLTGSYNKVAYFNLSPLTDSTARVYSFPDADGTLALTSNLSSYLPLTGGTLTGQLYINPTNTGIVGLDVASNTTIIRSDNLEGFKRQLEIVMGSGTLVQLTAKGYGANYGTDLAFYTATTGGTNASPGIYITGTNNRVGIKTGTPSYDLDITGDLRSSTSAYFGTTSGNIGLGTTTIDTSGGLYTCLTIDSSTYSRLSLQSSGVAKGRLQFDATNVSLVATATGGKLQLQTLGANAIEFNTNDAYRMSLNSSGCLNINTSGGYGKLDVGGQTSGSAQDIARIGNISGVNNGLLISVNSSNNYIYNFGTLGTGSVVATANVLSATSDMNLKIADGFIENALEKILKIIPRYFYWKEETGMPTNLRQLGFFAQEINESLGEEVANTPKNENEKWGIYDRGMIAMLTKAIQELNEKLIKNNIN